MNNPASPPVLRTEGLCKTFHKGGRDIHVLTGVELTLSEGQIAGIMGASGTGKSTLLHLLGGLDRPDGGRVLHRGRDIFSLSDAELAGFRNQEIGFVFQMHYLLSEFTCLENVMMPGVIAGRTWEMVREKARGLLARVGLEDRAEHRPGELSGGEQQRAAVARALVNDPALILADEPTGNLDVRTAESVRDLFFDLNNQLETTFLIVTHNREMAAGFHCRFLLKDGVLRREE
ncbi:lipoprotein-releasing system ATP-binding protein LolD [bacterium BMS3Abin14]|nr:lipoprotein-releasing system ATP-binding protein LolD [bacterium BMS3Abin14]